MSQNKLKGFQFVLTNEYEQMADDQKQGYMFFVRDNAEATEGKIYFGTRLYSSSVSSEDAATLADKIDALDMKADAIDTKTEANATKIDAFKDLVEVIDEKIGVVKDQSDVIEQKIDDIYNDTNRMREEFEELKSNAEEAIQKVDAETERAIAAEKVLQDEINKNAEELKAEASRVDGMVNQINENVASSINTLNQNMADGFNTINGGIAAEITERKAADEDLEANKVAWSSKDDHRIILENHKNLLGTSTEGNTYNLAMISKWDIADFGSSHLHLNLNSIDVPTVQLPGQSGEEAKHIAFSEDVPSITTVETLVNAEKDRAIEAESNLQTNINDNRNAMVQIQNGLQANINANTNAMVQIQNGLQANINANTNAINAEMTARQNADAALEQKIAAINVEELKAGIEKNASDIATVNTNLVTAVNDINKNVSDGFNTINGGIATEIDERKAADEQLKASTEKNASDIATVNTNLVNSINAINQNIANGFNTINGGIATEIEERKAADETLQAKIDEIGVEGMKADIKKNASDIATVNTNLVTSVNAINKNMADGFNTINGGINNEIRPEIILLRNEMDTMSLVKQSDLQYALKIGDRIAGTIDIPKDQWLKHISYDGENKVLKFTVETTEGDVETEINISDLVDVYLAGNGLELAGNVFSVKLDTASQKYIEVSENGIKVVGIDEAIKKLEDEKVSWSNIATDENPGRKAILLKNHDTILGTSTTGATANLLMLNKWDVVDLGTTQFPINLNTPLGIRPTVQEAGQSGAEAHQIAYVGDIETTNASIAAEIEARSAADTQLQADLAQEGTARSDADAELQTNIDAANTAISELQTALTGETEARSKGDTDLQDALSQEETSRTEADTQLQDNIDAANASIDELKEKKVDWIDISTAENHGRKAILLKNHDTILGTSTTGATFNLLMLNKWDVVDLGTNQFPINLNTPTGVRPTVQEAGQTGAEAHQIAYVSDFEAINTSIEEVNTSITAETEARSNADTQLQTALATEAEARSKGDIDLQDALSQESAARAEAINSVNEAIAAETSERKSEEDAIKAELAEKANKTDIPTELPNPNELSITYNGSELVNYKGSEAASANFVVNATTVPMSADEEKTVATQISEMNEEIVKKVTFENIPTEEFPERKKISLNNYDLIVGKGTDGAEYNIAMVSKWDKVDLGTSSLPINLNTPAGVRPTVQEAGQSGENANEIAYVSDLRLMPNEVLLPIETLADKVYTQEEILAWFGAEDVADLKIKIAYGGIQYIKYGILLTGNPHYYKMPLNYLAFESANQIKAVFNGLDISNDELVRYVILINLDGAIIEGNSNVQVSKYDVAMADKVKSDIIGNLDLQKYLTDLSYSVQVLNKLEQSYIDDLGTPENINGTAYNADTNNYSLNQPYLAFGKFDEGLVFHYDLYSLNGTFDMGYFGRIYEAIKINMDTYDSKLSQLEKRIATLEGASA